MDIAQHYETTHPGPVQVVGVDEWDGTAVDLRGFRDVTGATFPLLLLGTSGPGGNFATLYGTYDNYIVVNKQGIVRYHAALGWPHGNRYHLNEIRGCVDSLVSAEVGVDPGPAPSAFGLASAPNPARGARTLELSIPAGQASLAAVTVHDASGRRVATLWDGPAPAGLTRFAWAQVDASGAPLAAGELRLVTRF
ncbi:MAG: FlgD immunoglobulin-like domain containing protein [Candidatus Eiseniibacteriota bacterium]